MLNFKTNLDLSIQYDREHLWHPYTSATNPIPAYPVQSANGVYIRLSTGEKLIDGMSSWWAVIHGYNHPVLNQAAQNQLQKMSHVMFGGLTHEPAIQLAEQLINITDDSLQKIFLCDSGSVSVEVAMKMAIQYWFAQNQAQKSQFLTIRGGYHGDTFAAMSVCDPINSMHSIFSTILPKHHFAPRPQCKFSEKWNSEDIAELSKIIEINKSNLAAVILEPIVQGAGGMHFYSPQYLREVRQLCNQHNILLIADEIATGFGRTGKLFACEHAQTIPDIMCVGKALTGGYMSLAATITSDKVAHGISAKGGVFMHGPTFMGNPLATAIAVANLELLLNSPWQKRINNIQTWLKEGLSPCQKLDNVKDVRVLGAIGVVEMKKPVDVPTIQKQFIKQGVWIRPFGRLIYIMPAFIIQKNQLKHLTNAILSTIKKL